MKRQLRGEDITTQDGRVRNARSMSPNQKRVIDAPTTPPRTRKTSAQAQNRSDRQSHDLLPLGGALDLGGHQDDSRIKSQTSNSPSPGSEMTDTSERQIREMRNPILVSVAGK